MITVYGYPKSRSSRVTWALEEVGADYEFVNVDLGAGEGRREPFLSLNPGGKVPVLVEGDLVLTESGAILGYLGERFPDSGFTGAPGSVERAQCQRWCFFVIGELEQPLWSMAKHSFILPKEKRLSEAKALAAEDFAEAAGILEAGLGEREFLVGDVFGAADVMAGHTLGWARNAGMQLEGRLAGYAERLQARPALARARERELA